MEGSAPEQQDSLAEQRGAQLRGGERPPERVDEIHQSPSCSHQLGVLAWAGLHPDGPQCRTVAMGLALEGRVPHKRPGRGGRGDDGSMPKQREQIQAATAQASEPVLHAQSAHPARFGDGREALALSQPRHRVQYDLGTGHLARKRIARQDSLPAVAALAGRQRDGADPERRKRVKLARHAAARQARTRR